MADEPKEGKVVRFDPTLRKDRKKTGAAADGKGHRFRMGASAEKAGRSGSSQSHHPIRFQIFRGIQVVVVILAFAYVLRSCGVF